MLPGVIATALPDRERRPRGRPHHHLTRSSDLVRR